MFIHRDSQKKGLYYLAKETNCDIVLVKVLLKAVIYQKTEKISNMLSGEIF